MRLRRRPRLRLSLLGGGLSFSSQSASQSVTAASYADDSPASFTASYSPHQWEPRMDNATRIGTRVSAAGQLVLYPTRSAVACRERKLSVPDCCVLYTSTVAAGWTVGGRLQSSTKESCSTGRHPLSDPAKKASPGARNSICTYGGTTDSYYVHVLHVCTSTRLTNGIVSSRYQIAYRGHSRQALVSNLLTFRSRFPRPSTSPRRRSAGRVICQCQSRPLGFQRPLDYRLFSSCRPQTPPSPRKPGWGRLDETLALSVQRARIRGISQA